MTMNSSWHKTIELYLAEGRSVSGGCGASSTQEDLQAAQTAMYKEMSAQYTQTFAANQKILTALTMSFLPTLNLGINQQGFSQAELQNLEGQATTGTGQGYSNASKALAEAQGTQGGGTSYIPSGAKMQQQEQLASTAAQQEAGIESNIMAEDYATGRQNYLEAAGVLGGVAGQYNPAAFANATTGAGSAAATTANEVNQADSSWMNLAGAALGGGASVGSAFCPAKGSLYLMADGSERFVEMLKVGDRLLGIDGEPQTIEEIQTASNPILRVITDNGFVTRTSRVHAFALPFGGFTVAMFSLGKTVVTGNGSAKIISVQYDGQDEVFNVITDGSHTYRADGVWALGVGEAERHVSMDKWDQIGDRLNASH
jgi:hypothetical protein